MEKVEHTILEDISKLEIVEKQIDNSNNEEIVDSETIRRSSRRKNRPLRVEKRRVNTRPRRLPDGDFDKRIINYYLDKKIKKLNSSLETIFEQPKADVYMSKRKFSRSLPIRETPPKNKVKKRGMKAKKGKKIKKLPMDLLLKKLDSIEG